VVADALATDEVKRIRRKWELKYGRRAPALSKPPVIDGR